MATLKYQSEVNYMIIIFLKQTISYINKKNKKKYIDFSEHVEIVVKGRRNEYTSIVFLHKVIDLSGNSLMGEIPEEISNLSALNTLSLSWNQLTEKIPENIGSLRQLETLDLSSNHLSGPIPPSMSSMTFLSHLNLSHSNLSRQIPSGNQFNTWNDPSIYEGNLYICGAPLTTNCSSRPRDIDTEDRNEEVEDKNGSERFWFYVSMHWDSSQDFGLSAALR